MKIQANICFILLLILPGLLTAGEDKGSTLEDIIQIGLQNNPSLAAQNRALEAKKAAFQASKRLLNPELELQTGKAKSYDGLEKRTTGSITISQSLENPFKRHYRIQMFKNEWQAAEFALHSSRLKIISEIKTQFYEILFLQKNAEWSQKNLDSIREIYRLIQKRAQLGEVKQLEAIKLSVETLKAEKDLGEIQTRIRLAEENLNKYLGNILPPGFAISGELGYVPIAVDESHLLEKFLPSHPLMKEKENYELQAQNNISYVRWHRFPDFSLSGFSHRDLDGKNRGVGISFDIPLWNFKSREIAEAESLALQQSEEFRALRMELSTDIKTKLSRVKLSQQTLKLFISGLLKQAEESLKISQVSYKEGEISLIDFLDSQRTYFSIIKDYHQALFTWNADKAALERAIGEELK